MTSEKETILNKYFKHPEDNPLRIMNTFNCPPSEVLPGLWIGNFYDSENEELIRNLGIGTIINLTGSIRKLYLGIVHLVVLVNQPFQNTIDQARKAVYFIHQRRVEDDPILVHCLGGVDRAPTVVYKYLIDYWGLTSEDAIQRIKKVRPQALPHPDWWEGGMEVPKGA